MAQNQSGTYFYTPDVKIYVWSTVLGKPLDLSEDIVDFTVTRSINSTSTASVTLANGGFKYTPGRKSNNWNEVSPINTMDRIVIYLKREDYVQVFSGYVTLAPVVTLLPQPIVLRAHCTLYRVQNTFWDVNHYVFQSLMPGMFLTARNQSESFVDGGAAQGIVNVLTNVVDWDSNKIHIGALPEEWVKTVRSNSSKSTKDTLLLAIDAGGIISGSNLSGTTISGTGKGNYVTFSGLSPQVTAAVAIPNGIYTFVVPPPNAVGAYNLNGEKGYVISPLDTSINIDLTDAQRLDLIKKSVHTFNNPLEDDEIDPDWFCIISWPYANKIGFTTQTIMDAKHWLARDGHGGRGRKIVLTSIANGRQIVVRASLNSDIGTDIIISPKAWEWLAGDALSSVKTYFDLNGKPVSQGALAAIGGDRQGEVSFYTGTQVAVAAYWADTKQRVGKVTDTGNLRDKLREYGYSISTTLAQTQLTTNVVKQVATKTTKLAPLPSGYYPQLPVLVPSGTLNRTRSGLGQTTLVPISPTAPRKTVVVTGTKTVYSTWTTRDFAKQCLYAAGFSVNRWNMEVMLSWMNAESKGDSWDYRFNPFNCSVDTIDSVQGPAGSRWGAYASLEDAAKAWAKAINPRDGSPYLYPEINAAFSRSDSSVENRDYRNSIVSWARWSVKNKNRFTYTQDGRRMSNVKSNPYDTQHIYCDCSSFVTYCYSWAGAPDPNKSNYNGQGYTGTLLQQGQKIIRSSLRPGDVVVYGPGDGSHAVIVVDVTGAHASDPAVVSMGMQGDPSYSTIDSDLREPKTYLRFPTSNTYISANGPGNPYKNGRPWKDWEFLTRKTILSRAITSSRWSSNHYGNNPERFVRGTQLEATATAVAGQGIGKYHGPPVPTNTGGNTGNSAPTNANFNTSFTQPSYDIKTQALFGSSKGFVTSQPVLSSVSTMCSSSLREFQSAPNGDFIAWFPDYFGIYGQAPVLNIYDIEIIDFQMYHDDTFLATHVGVAGDVLNMGSSVDLPDWMLSQGIVSVQIPEVMSQLFGVDVSTLDPNFATNFLKRYGVRPKVQEVPIIRSHTIEFMYAWRLFLTSWAAQYSSQVQFTFLPELYPGMRIRLVDHNIEVYVQSVTHQGSRTGGFTTTAQVTCPVTRDSNGKVHILHFGFPYNKNSPESTRR